MTARSALRVGMLAIGCIVPAAACAPPATAPKPDTALTSKPVRELPKGPQHIAPRLALGGDRRVYAIWPSFTIGQRLFDVLFSRSDDDGMTWLPEPISLQREKSRNPGSVFLLVDREGGVYAFYALGLRGPKREVVVLRSSDQGLTWEGPTIIKQGNDVHASTFLRDGGGKLYAVIPVGPGDFDWRLELFRSSDKGKQWVQLPTLGYAHERTGTGIKDFQMAADDHGRVHALWSEASRSMEPAVVFYNQLAPAPDGGSWLHRPVRVSEAGASSRGTQHPRISLGGGDRVLAIWEEYRYPGPGVMGTFPPKIYTSSSAGDVTKWLPPSRLSPDGAKPAVSTGAKIATDGGLHAYAAWIDGDTNRPNHLKFARSASAGEGWTMPAEPLYQADPETYLAYPVNLKADAEGRVYLLWQQLEGESWKLLFNRSMDHGQTWMPKPYQLARTRQAFTGAHSLDFQVDGPRVFVAWDGGPGVNGDIFLTRSSDYGATWLGKDIQITRR